MAQKKKTGTKPAKPTKPEASATFPVQPRGDRVVVKMKVGSNETPGGIVLPDAAVERSNVGEVVAVGPGRRDKDGNLVPIGLKIGDRVLASTYGGSPLEADASLGIEGDAYRIMREDDVLATVEAPK